MYEMITGRVPFDADTAVSVALKQVQEKPVPPIDINRNIPLGLNQIILKAMEKDLALRYSSASEMLVDLEVLNKRPEVDFRNIDTAIKESVTKMIPTISNRVKVMEEEDDDPTIFEEKPWLRPTLIAILSVVLLFVIIFIVVLLVSKGGTGKETLIPNLTGEFNGKRLTKDEAIKILEERGFENYKIIEEYNEEVEKDFVFDQDPRYQDNFKVKLKAEFKVYISLGEKMEKIPIDLIGKKKEEVQEILEELKFKIEWVEEFNEDKKKFPEGVVFKIDPEEDKEVPLSKPIKVYVSKGQEHKDVEIPDVKGKTEAEAVKILKDLKLKTEVIFDIWHTDFGKVIYINPEAGKTVKEGDKVKIAIAKEVEIVNGEVVINFKKFLNPSEVKDVKVKLEIGGDIFINDKMISNQEENYKVEFQIEDYGEPVLLNLIVDTDSDRKIHKMYIKIYEKTEYKIP